MQQVNVVRGEATLLVQRLECAHDFAGACTQRHAQHAAGLIAGLLADAARQPRIVECVVDEDDLVLLDAGSHQAVAGRDPDRRNAVGHASPHLTRFRFDHPDAATVGVYQIASHVRDQPE